MAMVSLLLFVAAHPPTSSAAPIPSMSRRVVVFMTAYSHGLLARPHTASQPQKDGSAAERQPGRVGESQEA